MSSHVATDSRQVRSRSDLKSYILAGCKPSSQWVIGTEHEKIGWWPDRRASPDYFDDRGIRTVLEAFKQFGWVANSADETLLALSRGRATITLEPGGQLELSGAPLASLLETASEFDQHLDELKQISEGLNLQWSGIGLHPYGKPLDAPRMPKPRYDILESRLLNSGQLGIHMMRQTATVQANFDFDSEQDAMRKWYTSLMLQPTVMALFANSPIVDGVDGDYLSYRSRIWLDTDDSRCRLPDILLRPTATLADYVSWTVQVPMLFIHRDGQYLDCRGRTFLEFMQQGWSGHTANIGDYALHLSTLFPDVRLKQFLEVRGADMGDRDSVLALPAFHAGLLYDSSSLDYVMDYFSGMDEATWNAIRVAVCRDGLRTRVGDYDVGELAERLVEQSMDGLSRWEPAACVFLEPLLDRAKRRISPADDLRDSFKQRPDGLLDATRLV
ncbi:MAG: glutamate-cysteine ligase family protein [Myxococcota bacterium]|nr:glutamate-cysteine ligase family protein [Myxococcota bacterium]